MNRRFAAALATYAALAIVAAITLEGKILYATWILLGGIALKTWLAVLKQRAD